MGKIIGSGSWLVFSIRLEIWKKSQIIVGINRSIDVNLWSQCPQFSENWWGILAFYIVQHIYYLFYMVGERGENNVCNITNKYEKS